MPLRSVEAATRDDAIAAAREQFGPRARILGVRRVRSGGVLGFFATERYVAEVAPDQSVRPGVPGPATGPVPTTSGQSYDSPLASAAAARARTTAPARNGAAAWAAEAVPSAPPGHGTVADRSTTGDATARAAAPAASRPTMDDDRLDDLVSLLGAAPATAMPSQPAFPATPSTGYGRAPVAPATFPKATREPAPRTPWVDAPPGPETSSTSPARDGDPAPAATPSPFTAALARMVSGDRDVRQAVTEALQQPDGLPPATPVEPTAPGTAPDTPAPRPSLAAAIRSAEASTRSKAVRQEGTTVRGQDAAPASTTTTGPAGLSASADSGEVAAPSSSTRQEEIAEALRSALDQGHSDEALAGILRKMLAGGSPQAALAEPVTEEPLVEVLTEEPEVAVSTAAVDDSVAVGTAEPAESLEIAPLLARTASDPAPMTTSLDATTVMPRVSLLPSLPGSRGRGLPPVPPSSRSALPPSRPPVSGAAADRVGEAPGVPGVARRTPARAGRALATVTRLPVAPLMASDDLPEMPELDDAGQAEVPGSAVALRTARAVPSISEKVVARLTHLGVPPELLGDDFATQVQVDGTYAALTRALAARLPEAPGLPSGVGDVLFVVGPGVETLRTARSLAALLRLDPDHVQWATRGDLAALAPASSRITTIDAAIDRCQEASTAGAVTIVAIDAPLRGDVYWVAQMLAIWAPSSVWAVVEATRKPEDLELWLKGLARVDALVVQDADLSADPAAVLQRLTVPVALLDGVRATPHRWASLLCERLDVPQA